MTKTFEEFAREGKFVKLDFIGDSIDLIVKKDPFTLKPIKSKFKTDAGEAKIVFEYVFEDPITKEEKIWTNGSQSVARQMAKTKVGDPVRIIKVERNGKAAYAVRSLSPKTVSETENENLSQLKLFPEPTTEVSDTDEINEEEVPEFLK